jgi:hypothetical protein
MFLFFKSFLQNKNILSKNLFLLFYFIFLINKMSSIQTFFNKGRIIGGSVEKKEQKPPLINEEVRFLTPEEVKKSYRKKKVDTKPPPIPQIQNDNPNNNNLYDTPKDEKPAKLKKIRMKIYNTLKSEFEKDLKLL